MNLGKKLHGLLIFFAIILTGSAQAAVEHLTRAYPRGSYRQGPFVTEQWNFVCTATTDKGVNFSVPIEITNPDGFRKILGQIARGNTSGDGTIDGSSFEQFSKLTFGKSIVFGGDIYDGGSPVLLRDWAVAAVRLAERETLSSDGFSFDMTVGFQTGLKSSQWIHQVAKFTYNQDSTQMAFSGFFQKVRTQTQPNGLQSPASPIESAVQFTGSCIENLILTNTDPDPGN